MQGLALPSSIFRHSHLTPNLKRWVWCRLAALALLWTDTTGMFTASFLRRVDVASCSAVLGENSLTASCPDCTVWSMKWCLLRDMYCGFGISGCIRKRTNLLPIILCVHAYNLKVVIFLSHFVDILYPCSQLLLRGFLVCTLITCGSKRWFHAFYYSIAEQQPKMNDGFFYYGVR